MAHVGARFIIDSLGQILHVHMTTAKVTCHVVHNCQLLRKRKWVGILTLPVKFPNYRVNKDVWWGNMASSHWHFLASHKITSYYHPVCEISTYINDFIQNVGRIFFSNPALPSFCSADYKKNNPYVLDELVISSHF